jgi:hypothetical protein
MSGVNALWWGRSAPEDEAWFNAMKPFSPHPAHNVDELGIAGNRRERGVVVQSASLNKLLPSSTFGDLTLIGYAIICCPASALAHAQILCKKACCQQIVNRIKFSADTRPGCCPTSFPVDKE